MKKLIFSILFLVLATFTFAQKASVEKSTFGIQTGVLGIWGYNELQLSNTFVLRSEVGLDAGIWGGTSYSKTGVAFIPTFNIGSRWYYNLKKRVAKGKSIDGNSGNFLSLKAIFHPDLFVISNYNGLSVLSHVIVVPNWGIRRNIGSHFNYEVGTGLAFVYYFPDKANGYSEGSFDHGLFVNLRIGYRF